MAENEDLKGTENNIDYKAEFEKMQAEQAKWKASFDKASSEVANYKKQLAEKQTDEEKRQAEILAKEEHYKAIERENSIIKTKSKLAETIKDGKILDEVAQLYADGDVMTALEKQNAYLANSRSELEKQIKAELLKSNPTPPPSNPSGNEPKKDFNKMGYKELLKLKTENPEEYNKIVQK